MLHLSPSPILEPKECVLIKTMGKLLRLNQMLFLRIISISGVTTTPLFLILQMLLEFTESLLPTKDGITVTPSVWLALVREFSAIDQAFDVMEKYLLSRTVSYFPELSLKMSLISCGNVISSERIFLANF
ncbi:hypothetical protein TNIN_151961 [Trichonephila inaurata madagascariensis]|uniref:Uncharacterized protein n=1 Tax=Trichonephila inaurata madagascariensis TaxID=2747483 RepID=A0A8X6IGC5_9ARAC|nr:hypothetical protein TNIN_151961 [Trichonephila inaurata madagascariensis]